MPKNTKTKKQHPQPIEEQVPALAGLSGCMPEGTTLEEPRSPALINAEAAAAHFAKVCAIPLPPDIHRGLTAKQITFCYEIFRDGNKQAAALRAGYSENTAKTAAWDLMKVAGIKAGIDALMVALADEKDLPRSFIERKLFELYQVSAAAVPVVDKHGRPTGKYRVDGATAARCLELLGKARRMFDSKVVHEHTGSITHLLRQVNERGKPQLSQEPITIEHEPAAGEEPEL